MNCIHISTTKRDNGGGDGGGDGNGVASRRGEREGAREGEVSHGFPVVRGTGRVEKGGYRRAR